MIFTDKQKQEIAKAGYEEHTVGSSVIIKGNYIPVYTNHKI